MSELMEATRQELLDRLEVAESDEEFAAIEAALGLTSIESPWLVTTLRDVAEFFGVHEATVKSWRGEGLPGVEGQYDLGEMTRWRVAKAERRGGSLGDESERELIREERRLNIKRKQRELNDLEGLLGNKVEMLAEVTELFGAVRLRLEAMPSEFAPRFPASYRDELVAMMRDGICLVLKELAAFGITATDGN